jgi:hypothetical protein|tara:strand:- start:64 stop:384 length:321 start_codon:yes stop_codon:yes gene_type:complete
MAAKFVQFIDAADDAALYPVSNIQSLTCAGDGALVFKFAPGSLGVGQAASIDSVALTITADTEKTVMKNIGEAIAFSKEAVVLIADDVTGDYVDANITACAITLDA